MYTSSRRPSTVGELLDRLRRAAGECCGVAVNQGARQLQLTGLSNGKIKFVAAASGALLPVIGVGNAKVMGANGELVGLGNVLLVEGLSANLLSVSRLQKSRAEVTFGPTSCRAKLGKLLLWNLEEKSSCIKYLWQLPIIPWNGQPPTTAAAAAMAKATAGAEETASTAGALDAVKKVQQPQQPHGEVLTGVDGTAAWAKASSGSGEADWETWHERLCHINISMLQKMVKDGSLKGLVVKGPAKEIGSCPTCLETKFTKFPFSSSTGPIKAPISLVHMDVVGPTRALSLSGSHYFLTIVDDHTRLVWVYPLKTKGGVAAAVLKEWMPRARRESGHKVKVIRTDNGGEFISANFEKELKRKGILHHLIEPYNPQQNNMAERFNQTDDIAHYYWAAVPEPKTLAEALSGPDAEKWKQSVKEEYDSLLENETWELCEVPPRKKVISSKLVFRHKYGYNRALTRYKSRLVAKGFQQTKEKDFDEIFAPVGKGTTLRVSLATAANCGWRIKQMDITTAFLNGIILEELYMQWFEDARDAVQSKYCEGLAEKYGLQNGGKPATLLPSGFTVEPSADEEVVGESDRKLFHSMVGALNYAANHTWPDIAFATSRLASMVSRPSHEAAKRLVRYVSATASVGLECSSVRERLQRGAADLGKGEMLLTCYTNASFNSVKADGTSIGGYVWLFGGGAVSSRSKKQNEVGLSSCKTEYMALHHGAKEVVWLRRLLEEIGVGQKELTVIFCDNESAMKLANNACLHGLTKLIRPKWHWVRRLLEKEVRLEIVKTH
ncbi:unnamed protein product [Closterium sp. NIES-54]